MCEICEYRLGACVDAAVIFGIAIVDAIKALVGCGAGEPSKLCFVAACFEPCGVALRGKGTVTLRIVAAGIKTNREDNAETAKYLYDVALMQSIGCPSMSRMASAPCSAAFSAFVSMTLSGVFGAMQLRRCGL